MELRDDTRTEEPVAETVAATEPSQIRSSRGRRAQSETSSLMLLVPSDLKNRLEAAKAAMRMRTRRKVTMTDLVRAALESHLAEIGLALDRDDDDAVFRLVDGGRMNDRREGVVSVDPALTLQAAE